MVQHLLKHNLFFSLCSLLRNPLVHKPAYRYYVIHRLPQLRVLDFKRIRLKVGVAYGSCLNMHEHVCLSVGASEGGGAVWREEGRREVEVYCQTSQDVS